MPWLMTREIQPWMSEERRDIDPMHCTKRRRGAPPKSAVDSERPWEAIELDANTANHNSSIPDEEVNPICVSDAPAE
jgi:hypothetical protein